MSFQVGDRVRLTGSGWPEVATNLPPRGAVVTIESAEPSFGGSPNTLYRVAGFASRILIDTTPSWSWGGKLVASAPVPTPRAEALTKAADLIGGDRQETYGSPAESFGRIAKLWSALLGTEINASQVAMMLAAMKLSRLTGQNDHADSWIDLAGYAGLGYEISKGQ